MTGQDRVRHVVEDAPDLIFFTTKDPSKGTGLGLSIVCSVTKESGGPVTFTSVTNEGTTFEVLLPLVGGR